MTLTRFQSTKYDGRECRDLGLISRIGSAVLHNLTKTRSRDEQVDNIGLSIIAFSQNSYR